MEGAGVSPTPTAPSRIPYAGGRLWGCCIVRQISARLGPDSRHRSGPLIKSYRPVVSFGVWSMQSSQDSEMGSRGDLRFFLSRCCFRPSCARPAPPHGPLASQWTEYGIVARPVCVLGHRSGSLNRARIRSRHPCCARQGFPLTRKLRSDDMLGMIAAVLIVLWLLGFFAFHVSTGLIHILLVIGIVMLLFHLFRGRTATA